MSKFAVFATATITDAVSKAAAIAPSKGAAFDRSAGIVLDVEPLESLVTLRATNLEITYRERVNALEVGDESASWRLPSGLLSGILGGLPIGSGNTVKLTEDKRGWVNLSSGRRRSKLNQIRGGSFPSWVPFDEDDMSTVEEFSNRVRQAAWACSKDVIPFSGVHMTGEDIVATDRYRIVRVPCKVPVERAITVPLTLLSPILKTAVDMRVRAEERRLLLMPDDFTQITSVIFDAEYPSRDKLKSVMRDNFEYKCGVERDVLLNTLNQMMVLVKTERYPNCRITVSHGEMHLYMHLKEEGEIEDTLDVNYTDDEFVFDITPTYLIEALDAATTNDVVLWLGPGRYQTVGISDGEEYFCWLMPRKLEEE